MLTPEGRVRTKVRDYLKSIGAYRFSPVPVGWGSPPLDDFCCIGGKFVGIEYKREGKVPTPRQRMTMQEVHRAGGIAIWGDSAEDIIEKLKKELGLPD